MIYLKKGQVLKDNPGMLVYDPTGYYNDGDSVVCSSVISPEEPACRFEAKYIAYGGLVYSVSDPDLLLEQVIKMDPNSLFGKDSKQIAVDKMVDNIVPQKSSDLTKETPAETSTETNTTESEVNNVQSAVSTTTPNNTIPSINTSTTTPSILPEVDTSTSTPTITPPVDLSTTTPGLIPDINTSTTTPDIILDANTSTTSPNVLPDLDTSIDNTSTTTPNIIIEPATESNTTENIDNNMSTTSEVVAFAKKIVKNKITRELGL
jgi:hypothetical protein